MQTAMSGRLFLNTFRPLVCSAYGRSASKLLKIPPYVDASIRREPDLQHKWPSISCLCRGERFAPRLRVGDHVAYLTVKGRYGDSERHRRLVAVLEVVKLFDSHGQAAAWYRS